jgi:hypothetical protein
MARRVRIALGGSRSLTPIRTSASGIPWAASTCRSTLMTASPGAGRRLSHGFPAHDSASS